MCGWYGKFVDEGRMAILCNAKQCSYVVMQDSVVLWERKDESKVVGED